MARSVLAAFEELLARQRLTDSQLQVAKTRVRTLSEFLARSFSLHSGVVPIGSYARATMCAGERDIDLMVPFEPYGQTNYWRRCQQDSSRFLYLVRNELNDRYAATQVGSKRMAVTLDFTDILTDVVPAFPRDGGGFLIPNGTGGWKSTNPPYHTQLINNADQAHNGRLKPLIRLMKAWNIANGHHLASFHIELLMARIWLSSAIADWPSAMATNLKVLPSWLDSAFPDPWAPGGTITNSCPPMTSNK